MEMLAFNFASRTFAYKRLAQGLSKSMSAFSSFMREYLDPVSKMTIGLNRWTTLATQSKMLGTLAGAFGQSSSAFSKQA